MRILIVGIAQTEAFVLPLAPPTSSKRKERRITTHPLITTRRCDQRRLDIATEATMLTSNRFGFHSIVCHGLSLCVGMGFSGRERARQVPRATHRSLLCDHVHLNLPPCSVTMGAGERAHPMRPLSKVKHSRNQWKAKATQRSDPNRYLRKQLARLKAERAQAKQELQETQTRLRQRESQVPAVAVRPQVDVVGLALHLFVEARISCRAVCRVLTLLAADLGITRAPCPPTVLNWIIQLSIVRMESARGLRGLPLAHAPFSNGLIWMIDGSIGLGSGKI